MENKEFLELVDEHTDDEDIKVWVTVLTDCIEDYKFESYNQMSDWRMKIGREIQYFRQREGGLKGNLQQTDDPEKKNELLKDLSGCILVRRHLEKVRKKLEIPR